MGQIARDFIKSPSDIAVMRKGGSILADILSQIKAKILPGVDSMALESYFIELCKKYDVEPSCKDFSEYGMPAFPTGLCLSINSQCVHCYPKKGVFLKEGDVLTVDTVIKYKGLHVDSSFAMGVGNISDKNKRLLSTCEKALYDAINKVSDNVRIGEISNRIQKTVEQAGFNVLKDYAGHGIGKEMHEWPQILCYGNKNSGPKLMEGMTICIESLVCSGNGIVGNKNFWETFLIDGGIFVQFEHTVLVTKNGYEILTISKK